MPQLMPSKQIDSGVQLSLTLASGCDGAAVIVLPSTVELTLDSVVLSVGIEVGDGTSGTTLILGEPYSRLVLMTAAVAVEARSVGKRNFILLLGLLFQLFGFKIVPNVSCALLLDIDRLRCKYLSLVAGTTLL